MLGENINWYVEKSLEPKLDYARFRLCTNSLVAHYSPLRPFSWFIQLPAMSMVPFSSVQASLIPNIQNITILRFSSV